MSKCYHRTLFCLHHNSCTFHPLKFSLIMRGKKNNNNKKHKWAVQVMLGLKCHITIHVHADILQQPSIDNYNRAETCCFFRERDIKTRYLQQKIIFKLPSHPLHYNDAKGTNIQNHRLSSSP